MIAEIAIGIRAGEWEDKEAMVDGTISILKVAKHILSGESRMELLVRTFNAVGYWHEEDIERLFQQIPCFLEDINSESKGVILAGIEDTVRRWEHLEEKETLLRIITDTDGYVPGLHHYEDDYEDDFELPPAPQVAAGVMEPLYIVGFPDDDAVVVEIVDEQEPQRRNRLESRLRRIFSSCMGGDKNHLIS